ncbi:MAG TPA: 2Fe-2S iron-sulfur cluster-binding protein [Bacteroidales bacterium]|nr:2Fe-2S iron-sulfur cluster-binding protein [Bacteroidales bacterium]HPS62228.1 2Fe-2S iron-sulfur cluster-binding protein [Bacteroidales bacterium]
MIRVTIDNITVEVEEGTSILEAARKIGGKVVPPAMCYYSKLKGSGGKCRTCLVKVAQSSAKDPRPMPKLVASCSTPAQDGMVVQNLTSPEVVEARKGIVEMLLVNHPLDCPVCDQAGECDLQDLSFHYGIAETATEEERREFVSADLGDYIKLHMNRCILCYRCVFVADQLTGERRHGVLYRGDAADIGTYIRNAVDNDFSGNMIDACPVGALTDRTFRFKSRVWFLKPMDAHRECSRCSGKVTAWMHGNEIYRITARKDRWNEAEEFICNECRFEKKNPADWVIEGPRQITRESVISANHYEKLKKQSIIKPIEGIVESTGE